MRLKRFVLAAPAIALILAGGPLMAIDETDLRTLLTGRPVCQGCNLSRADLSSKNLRGARLRQTDLTEADLSGSNLVSAYFTCAVLEGADLRNANLQWANLVDADLRGTDLRGADLSKTDLTGAQFAGARLDDTTVLDGAKLPDGATLYNGTQDLLRVQSTRSQEEQRRYCEARRAPR